MLGMFVELIAKSVLKLYFSTLWAKVGNKDLQ